MDLMQLTEIETDLENDGSHLLQDALVEELLQFLVTVVDAELLEAVVFKVLWKNMETESVKDESKENLTTWTILRHHVP